MPTLQRQRYKSTPTSISKFRFPIFNIFDDEFFATSNDKFVPFHKVSEYVFEWFLPPRWCCNILRRRDATIYKRHEISRAIIKLWNCSVFTIALEKKIQFKVSLKNVNNFRIQLPVLYLILNTRHECFFWWEKYQNLRILGWKFEILCFFFERHENFASLCLLIWSFSAGWYT